LVFGDVHVFLGQILKLHSDNHHIIGRILLPIDLCSQSQPVFLTYREFLKCLL